VAVVSSSADTGSLPGLASRASSTGTLSQEARQRREAIEPRSPAERLADLGVAPENPAGADDVRDVVRLAQGLDPEEGAPSGGSEPAIQVGRDDSLPTPADTNRAQVIDIAV
jgi:hypothetical protein